MARRANLRDLGCIASDDLADIGAGKEGWHVLAALDTSAVALSNRSVVLILPLDADAGPAVKIRPSLSPLDGNVSAVEWIASDDLRVVAVGTSNGYLLLYSAQAKLIHKQMINFDRILKIKAYGMTNGFAQEASSDGVCIVMPGVIAKVDGSDIQNLLKKWVQDSEFNYWGRSSDKKATEDDDCPYGKLKFQLWNIGKYGPCVDAAISGVMPPPLLELESTERYYSAVAIGADAVISAFRLSIDKNRSLVGAILSRVVPAAYSTITSVSKIIWRRSSQSPPKKAEVPQSFAKASPLTCLKDNPRKGEKLTLSPSGSLAAITDSLGRVLLLDTQALVVVRLWKGYRDATCLFMEMLVQKDGASTSTSAYHELTKSDYCLCLAINAPRKGIVEIWKMRTGPRILIVQCPKGSRILQPAYKFGSSSSSFSYSPLEVYILNGDSGRISVLNQSLG